MRKSEREMDSQFALDLIEKCEYSVIASVNEDGTPYAIPVSPVFLNGCIYIHGDIEGKKNDNFSANKNVCITAIGHTKLLPQQFSTEFESAVVNGKIEKVEDKEEKIAALMKICEKYAASNLEKAPKFINAMIEKTGVYKITVKNATGKAYKLK